MAALVVPTYNGPDTTLVLPSPLSTARPAFTFSLPFDPVSPVPRTILVSLFCVASHSQYTSGVIGHAAASLRLPDQGEHSREPGSHVSRLMSILQLLLIGDSGEDTYYV